MSIPMGACLSSHRKSSTLTPEDAHPINDIDMNAPTSACFMLQMNLRIFPRVQAISSALPVYRSRIKTILHGALQYIRADRGPKRQIASGVGWGIRRPQQQASFFSIAYQQAQQPHLGIWCRRTFKRVRQIIPMS
jgi:hypothetical protein